MKEREMKHHQEMARRLFRAAVRLRPLLVRPGEGDALVPVEAPGRADCHRLRRTLRDLATDPKDGMSKEVREVVYRLRYAAVMLCMAPPNVPAAEEALEHAELTTEALWAHGREERLHWATEASGWAAR